LSALPETSERVKVSRRSWPLEEKRRIVEEAFRPGMSVADVARRHGLNSNQVFNWRKMCGKRPAAEISEAFSSVPQARPDTLPACATDGFFRSVWSRSPKTKVQFRGSIRLLCWWRRRRRIAVRMRARRWTSDRVWSRSTCLVGAVFGWMRSSTSGRCGEFHRDLRTAVHHIMRMLNAASSTSQGNRLNGG
jgi:transposase-like protein